jgi:hypothetical protein
MFTGPEKPFATHRTPEKPYLGVNFLHIRLIPRKTIITHEKASHQDDFAKIVHGAPAPDQPASRTYSIGQ